MSVTVNIPAFLLGITKDTKAAEVSGETVGECLNGLVKKYPRLDDALFDRNGKLHSYLDVFINRKSSHPEVLARKVKDGDELHILNILLGG